MSRAFYKRQLLRVGRSALLRDSLSPAARLALLWLPEANQRRVGRERMRLFVIHFCDCVLFVDVEASFMIAIDDFYQIIMMRVRRFVRVALLCLLFETKQIFTKAASFCNKVSTGNRTQFLLRCLTKQRLYFNGSFRSMHHGDGQEVPSRALCLRLLPQAAQQRNIQRAKREAVLPPVLRQALRCSY